MTNKVAFINNKGGCGKTTSLFHIAGELASRGKKVLVLDFDKQCDTTNNFLSEEESEYEPAQALTIFDYISGSCSFSDCVKKNYIRVGNKKPEYHGIDVVPSDNRLERQTLLSAAIKDRDVKGLFEGLGYDFILVDCPPSNRAVESVVLGQIADGVVVPMSADLNTIRGYGKLLDKVKTAREQNPNLQIIGIYFSMFFRNRSKNKEYREIMIKKFPDLFIDIQIPNCTDIVKAIEDKGQPMAFYKKESVGANEAIQRLVDEIIDRI